MELLTRGGSHVADEECRSFVQLVTNAPHLQGYAGRALYRAACDERAHFQLAAVASWVLGEYGDAVVSNERLEGEPGLVVSRGDVVGLLDSVLNDPHTPGPVKQMTATALAKLATRFPDEAANVRAAVARVGGSLNLELQQRAAEFVKIFDKGPALSAPLLERMPPIERKSDATGGELSRSSSGAVAPAPAAAATGADLLGDLMGLDDAPSTTTGASARASPPAPIFSEISWGCHPPSPPHQPPPPRRRSIRSQRSWAARRSTFPRRTRPPVDPRIRWRISWVSTPPPPSPSTRRPPSPPWTRWRISSARPRPRPRPRPRAAPARARVRVDVRRAS